MALKERNILLVYILSFITLGIYYLYWLYKTKNELNELGANIPSFILYFIPIVNIYWLYRYTEGWAHVTKKDNAILYFILFLLVGIIKPYLVQRDLNEIARNYGKQQMMRQGMPQ
ncbi:hypothetical protein DDW05_00100 [Candidatus Nanobsidianus stetteri]|uniref:DUF4234 domain-containing protein n=1 Tax=Nanobsidianus stetteri TaxID=1294122 RepID=A0A2T9WV11_NANST|nr:hypothetical protein DDW05_00100 [Candidatus Nanobsidianus stetteri]